MPISDKHEEPVSTLDTARSDFVIDDGGAAMFDATSEAPKPEYELHRVEYFLSAEGSVRTSPECGLDVRSQYFRDRSPGRRWDQVRC